MTGTFKELSEVTTALDTATDILHRASADGVLNTDDLKENFGLFLELAPQVQEAIKFENPLNLQEMDDSEVMTLLGTMTGILFKIYESLRLLKGLQPEFNPNSYLEIEEIYALANKIAEILDEVSEDGKLGLSDALPVVMEFGEITDLVTKAVKFNYPVKLYELSPDERVALVKMFYELAVRFITYFKRFGAE